MSHLSGTPSRLVLALVFLVAAAALAVGCQPGNRPPEIESLGLPAGLVPTNSQATFHPQASDPDDDVLTYHWEAGRGTFVESEIAQAVWIAPATAGSFEVTLTVTDGDGLYARESAWIRVGQVTADLVVRACLVVYRFFHGGWKWVQV